MININRNNLLTDLFDYSQAGSGLIVGKPGVGKSYILKQLKDYYLVKNILSVMIKIDNLYDASDASIQEELGYDSNWIDTLKKIKISDTNKALLIFDAFDAARNETFRNHILSQIKKAKEELHTKWNILVSVRTYDASKSQKLIQLFPLSEEFSDNLNCRKRYIPVLEEEEIIQAISSNSVLLQFFTESTKTLKEILRIPFFLNLSEKIISDSSIKEIQELKKLKSETQLLKTYWDKIVSTADNHLIKEKILINLTELLVKSKSLNCSKKSFLAGFESADSESFEYLRSENIIDEISIGGNRISFSHNILFDYAVSRLYITSEVEEVLQFIKEDASRPFFLRPSFVYFFTQLWYEQRELFWVFFWRFINEKIKEVQLFVRLVLTGVISSEYNSLTELKAIMGYVDSKDRNPVIRNFLQSIRFIRKKTLPQDIEMLEYLSTNLDPTFIWDFAFLLDRAINDPDREELQAYGIAARNFLSYVLDKRKTDLKQFVDRIGATRGVELVAKTYGTDVQASKKLLRSLFDLLKEPDFEIYYFSSLSEYIKNILNYDAGFVAEVYSVLFGHIEISDAQTSMAPSVIMNLLSNRRQDFELCHFRLTEFYPTFLSHSPEHAIPVGLRIVNDYVIRDRKNFHYESTEDHFNFKGEERIFIQDLSSIWADSIHYHKPAGIANQITGYFEKLLESSKIVELEKFLNLYIHYSQVGYTWKTIINFGTKAVGAFNDYFFDFCVEEMFLTTSDTSYEIGQLIEEGGKYFSAQQIKVIEEKIHEITKKSKKTNPDYFLRRFLSRLPIEKLQLEKSKSIIEKSGSIENEKPYEHTSSVEAYTTEMWLKDKGVDTTDAKTSELLSNAEELKTFNHIWLNGTPPGKEYSVPFEKGQLLFYTLKEYLFKINDNVLFSILSDIALTFTIISRDVSNLTESQFKVLKEIVLYCYNYVSDYDKSIDDKTSPSRGYSPTPRIVAAEGLPQIAFREDTKQNIDLLISATNDVNSIIRFHACKHINLIIKKQPKVYWEIIYSRLEMEDDAFVASVILASIRFDPYEEKTANEVLDLAYKNEKLFKWNNSFIDNFVLLTIWLYIQHKNELAYKILFEAYEREEFCRAVIFKAFEDFRISSFKDNARSELFIDSTLKWTINYLTKTGELLKEIKPEEFKNENPIVKKSLSLIDLIIQRIYFVFQDRQIGNRPFFRIPDDNRKYLYLKVKPIFEKTILVSSEIPGGGVIVGHTAHYFIETLNAVLQYEPKEILAMVTEITKLSFQAGYTFDSMAVREMVNLTEKLLADHRELLTEDDSFNNLINLLDMYMNSGWVEALELLWKLDEIFK